MVVARTCKLAIGVNTSVEDYSPSREVDNGLVKFTMASV